VSRHLVVIAQVLDREDAVLGFFHGWCEELARHVERLTVFAQRAGAVDLPASARVVSLGREQGAGKLRMAHRLGTGLLRLRGRDRPSAVLAHMVPKFVLYAAPACTPRGVPLYLWYTHKGVDRALRMAVPLVRRVFTASEASFRLPGAADKVVVTGHGIDCEAFVPPPPGARPVDVLSVGRIAPSKGQDELLDALARCPSRPRTEIAGDVLLERDVPFRQALAARVAREFADSVALLGAVPHPRVADAMRRARVLVNASRTGSVDKVVLEAMACGTLPLTCNEAFDPIFEEAGGPELRGRLTFPRGDPETLAARLAALLALPAAEADALGARLREVVRARHDLRALVPRLVGYMS